MRVMVNEIKGQIVVGSGRYAIVVSRFNEFVTSKLLGGAIDTLQRHGANDEQITVVWVPGACEITQVAKKLAASQDYAAVICLGAILRGQTTHYEAVCQQVVRGVGQINYDTQVPTVFGILTCDTLEQAIERSGVKMGNTGANAALTAMEMVSLLGLI
jgi:6,7-dimethyl-8-ribityllumazine synthase